MGKYLKKFTKKASLRCHWGLKHSSAFLPLTVLFITAILIVILLFHSLTLLRTFFTHFPSTVLHTICLFNKWIVFILFYFFFVFEKVSIDLHKRVLKIFIQNENVENSWVLWFISYLRWLPIKEKHVFIIFLLRKK